MSYPDIKLEESLWEKGYKNVIGVDEAGIGPLAGPVVAAAVLIHSPEQVVEYVKDSKKMTAKNREKAFEEIKSKSSAFGIGLLDVDVIDEVNIHNAVNQCIEIAIEELDKKLDGQIGYIIIDGNKFKTPQPYPAQGIKKGDLYHYSISAASVLAKVTRDKIMKDYAEQYPEYGFENHMGYATEKHKEALEKYGPCRIHRKSYKPVADLLTS